MSQSVQPVHTWARFPCWIVLGAVLLPCIYLPSLGTRFDFIDDGNLVYPSPPMPLDQRLEWAWGKVVANYRHLGPFRPTLWAHWEVAAELLDANPVAWRATRLVWTMFACGALLWLLQELRIRPGAALLTAALAIWNPYRGEVWTSLTLSEGVAMPYALLALVCAIRAGRSTRPWPWDLAGAVCVLVALGCKNTFAAVVPAQLLLRVAPDGQPLWEGLRRHGRAAGLLALTLLLPICHYLYFKSNWRPGQYEPPGPSVMQFVNMLRAVKGALSLDYTGVGLGMLVGAAVFGMAKIPETGRLSWLMHRNPAAWRAGLALLLFGIVVYLPMNAISGRYSMPAAWGADLCLATLLTAVAESTTVRWRRAAYAAFACGLAAVAVTNVGKQDRFASRADLFWQTLEWVERQAPPDTCLGWVSSPQLNVEEGIHFLWHLRCRGREDLKVQLLDEHGNRCPRTEMPAAGGAITVLITGTSQEPPGGPWKRLETFAVTGWFRPPFGQCYLWGRETATGPGDSSRALVGQTR